MRCLPLLVLLFLLPVGADAGSLDAPGTKPITVRNEIDRGQSAVLDLAVKYSDIADFGDAIEKLVLENTQRGTDTPGFLLGMAFQQWQSLWSRLNYGVYKGPALDLALLHADVGFKGYLNWRKKLGLTPEQVKECATEYGGQSEDELWARVFAVKNFRDSYPHAHKRPTRTP